MISVKIFLVKLTQGNIRKTLKVILAFIWLNDGSEKGLMDTRALCGYIMLLQNNLLKVWWLTEGREKVDNMYTNKGRTLTYHFSGAEVFGVHLHMYHSCLLAATNLILIFSLPPGKHSKKNLNQREHFPTAVQRFSCESLCLPDYFLCSLFL